MQINLKIKIMKKIIFISTISILIVIAGIFIYDTYFSLPEPVLVSSDLDDSEGSILNYHANVFGEILNTGNEGNVLIYVIVTQDGVHFEQYKRIYMHENETSTFSINFDDVKYLSSRPEFAVVVTGVN
jgi:hypothetical protein